MVISNNYFRSFQEFFHYANKSVWVTMSKDIGKDNHGSKTCIYIKGISPQYTLRGSLIVMPFYRDFRAKARIKLWRLHCIFTYVPCGIWIFALGIPSGPCCSSQVVTSPLSNKAVLLYAPFCSPFQYTVVNITIISA